MRWIGLTGGIASGKSTVSRALIARGFPVIDADEIAKDVVRSGSPGLKLVVEEFGEGILNQDGTLNRAKLGGLVFGHQDKLIQLERILHPLIRAETQKRRQELEANGEPLAIYDIPLLFETNSKAQFDFIIVVSCTKEQQRERLRRRNNLSESEVEERLAAQLSLEVKANQADFIIDNNSDEQNLTKEVDRLVNWLKSLPKN